MKYVSIEIYLTLKYMSTSLRIKDNKENELRPVKSDFRCVIIKAVWNEHITGALAAGAQEHFKKIGVPEANVSLVEVPGAVELVYAARRVIDSVRPDAVIILGCVIRGDTPHFDYVCDNVTLGTARLNAEGRVPVIFGLLTVDTEQQALDRAGGLLGNKGTEAAEAAVAMSNLSVAFPVR